MIFRGMRGRISGCVQRRGAEDGAVGLGLTAGTQPLLRHCQHHLWLQSTSRCSRANTGPGGTEQAAGLWHLLCPSALGYHRHVTGVPQTRQQGSPGHDTGGPTDVALEAPTRSAPPAAAFCPGRIKGSSRLGRLPPE